MSGFLRRLLGRPASVSGEPQHEPGVPQHMAGEEDVVERVLGSEQTEQYRRQFLAGRFQKAIGEVLTANPELQSVTLLVGQYWCDEAYDAVQAHLLYSRLSTPNLDSARKAWLAEKPDFVNLTDGSQWNVVTDYAKNPLRHWDENNYCIPLFASFCVEGGHQDGDGYEFDSPIAIYRLAESASVEMEFVGMMVRPWLDGAAYGGVAAAQFDLPQFERWISKGH